MASSLLVMLLLFGSDFLGSPPGDLASLVNPESALQQMQAATDEASLRKLLTEEATQDPPAAMLGDRDYVRRLMAIRLLEKRKSRAALPELRRIAEGDDVTLGDAAAQAVALIEGEKLPRPEAAELLKQIEGMVPADSGFVAVSNLVRDSRGSTVADYLQMITKDSRFSPIVAEVPTQMMQQAAPQAENALLQALAMVGNVRVDAVAVAVSENIGEDTGQVSILVKGLWDPERIGAACTQGMQQKAVGDHEIFYERHGPAICLLDENTALISFGPEAEGEHMQRVLAGVTGRKGKETPEHAARAFAIVRDAAVRTAASGRLTDVQKQNLKAVCEEGLRELRAESDPDAEIGRAWVLVGLGLTKVEMFEGRAGRKGRVLLQATCADTGSAAALHSSLDAAEKVTRQLILKEVQRMPAEFRTMTKEIEGGARLLESSVEKTQVTVRFQPLPIASMMFVPMLMMYKMSQPVQATPSPPPPTAP